MNAFTDFCGVLFKGAVDEAASQTDKNPTEAQAKSGNYRKGKVRIGGLEIAIETPKGAIRRGREPDGTPWQVTMPAHYGYVKRTEGADGDQVDVYLGPKADEPHRVWVIDQLDCETGEFDEHKVMIGFESESEAIMTYDMGFSDGRGPIRRGAVTELPFEGFKRWLKEGDSRKPFAWLGKRSPLRKFAISRGAAEETMAVKLSQTFRMMREIAGAISNPSELVTSIVSDAVRERLLRSLDPMLGLFKQEAVGAVMEVVPDEGPDRNIAFSFDAGSRKVREYLEEHRLNLVREITNKQERSLRAILTDSMLNGQPPAVTARRMRDVIGLTARQAQHVENYRRELESGDPVLLGRAMSRALRDRRFDSVIARAAKEGKPLDPETVDRYVEAYRRRYVAYRSMTIARTESLRAANMGSYSGIKSILEDRLDGRYEVVKIWMTQRDGRQRDSHDKLHGVAVRGIDTHFVTINGNRIKHPHDPEAPVEETANCRCTMAYRLVPKS